jgi:hypothetical protein
MLLAQKAYVEGGLALVLYCARLVDERNTAQEESTQKDADRLLGLLTPIAKSWPSQWCLAANDLAIQVHGGYGYSRDFNVEQFYRDNRLNSIHEGTHGIQALDLLGRKVRLEEGASIRLLDDLIRTTVAKARAHLDLAIDADQLQSAWRRLTCVTQALSSNIDRALSTANASLYLEAFGHVVIAWIWLDQNIIAAQALAGPTPGLDEAFYAGKQMACRYFFRWELPRVGPWLDLLEPVDTTCLEMHAEWY